MRGKVEITEKHGLYTGITPAYAGKSPARSLALRWLEDHPRICGEKYGTIFGC